MDFYLFLNRLLLYCEMPLYRQLLNECGIGLEEQDASLADPVSQHRVLIFCQLKTMLDIIENDLFKKHMPTVTYMRLDGTCHTFVVGNRPINLIQFACRLCSTIAAYTIGGKIQFGPFHRCSTTYMSCGWLGP